ncbi:MAG: hypothetical protein K6G62_04755, partial [Eubacterium sp.]|nr:hypothetical protein [Eubacterium sp.]
MTNDEKELLDSLSESAKTRFKSLTGSDKERFLKKAARVAEKLERKKLAQDKLKKKNGQKGKLKNGLKKGTKDVKDAASYAKEAHKAAIQYLLATGKVEGDDDRDLNEDSYNEMSSMMDLYSSKDTFGKPKNNTQRQPVRGSYSSPGTSNSRKELRFKTSKKMRRNTIRKKASGSTGKKASDIVKSIADKSKEVGKALAKVIKTALNPIVLIFGFSLIFIAATVGCIGAVVGAGSGAAASG